MKNFSVLVSSLFVIGFVFIFSCGTVEEVKEPEKVQTSQNSCPEPGTMISLKKVMSHSFIKDYEKCDVSVEAEFLKMGNDGYMLRNYDTSSNTTFQILIPGEAPQASLGGMSFGIFAGTPKSNSDILFDLNQGDKIILRGSPKGNYTTKGDLVIGVFHAVSVEKQ
ncbi:MAG: hypothetical protein ACOX2F_03380 [bacterium]